MDKHRTNDPARVLEAYRTWADQVRITNTKVGCFLVVTLMPAGSLLDSFVYPWMVAPFLKARLLCSLIAGVIWALLYTPQAKKSGKLLGIIVPLLPVVFIAWMIAVTEGWESPYYAGLNLVLLAVGVVLNWTTFESCVGVLSVLLIYAIACDWHGPPQPLKIVVNNLYFMIVMDVIVVVATYFQSRLRFREFALRYELDENRAMLESSNRKLIEMDQVKTAFFANISHELRTPLTLLLAPLEKLLNQKGLVAEGEATDLVRTMHTSGMRLLKLINDLLDLVRIESHKISVKHEPLAIGEFVSGLAHSIRRVADDKRIRLETVVANTVGVVLCDADKLEKVLLNLLFNSIKFTPAGGRIRLTVERQKERLILAVQDTGMGIAAEHLPFIFDRFWQADSSSRRKYQGTGIGLALVKELVEMQQGTVGVDSQLGVGTTVTVRLPYLEPDPALLCAPAGLPAKQPTGATDQRAESDTEWLTHLYRRAELFPALTPLQETIRKDQFNAPKSLPKALIADDEPDMLRFLQGQLSSQFQIFEAVDGHQAVEKASQFLPEIIVLDMMMPEKDGLQVCKELRQRLPTQNIPIVLLTARADEETKLAALAAGANDFLTKPFSTTELHVRLSNLVQGYQWQRKLSRQNQVLQATVEQLKETETQLVQSEKLASLGRMSAGIIHEINNPLNFVKTALYALRQKGDLLDPAEKADFKEILADIEEGIERVKNIVTDLRMFTHPKAREFVELNVSEIVMPALRFLSHEIKHIRVEQRIPDELTLMGNRNQLVQVLLNLLQNALDALRLKKFEDDQPTIWIEAESRDGLVVIRVRDNGPGISPEHAGKIFEPFFTTKEVGTGMGLGLSICYRIVTDHGGQIRVQNQYGTSCEFALEFPIKCEKTNA